LLASKNYLLKLLSITIIRDSKSKELTLKTSHGGHQSYVQYNSSRGYKEKCFFMMSSDLISLI